MPELKGDVKNHVFRKMVNQQLSVTICTDNRLVSNTTVSKEYRLAIDNFALTLKQLRDIALSGFKRCFFPGPYKKKREYVRANIDYFDAMVKKHFCRSYANVLGREDDDDMRVSSG